MPRSFGIVFVTYKYAPEIDRSSFGPNTPVIVVDNGADRASLTTEKDLTTLSAGKNLGFAKAINLGLRHFGWNLPEQKTRNSKLACPERAIASRKETRIPNPDLAFIVNPDAWITSGTLENAARKLEEDPTLGALGPLVLSIDGSVQASARAYPSLMQGMFNKSSILSRLLPDNVFTRMKRGQVFN